MKRPSVAAAKSSMEDHTKLKRRHSMELTKIPNDSEELEVLIPDKEDHSKPAPAIHLNVNGKVDRNQQLASNIVRVTGETQCQSVPAGTAEAVAEPKAQTPHTSLYQVFPKWLRVTRLWFNGKRSCSAPNAAL